MSKLYTHYTNALEKVKESYSRGKKWIGYDGLLNMETFALILMILMVFLQIKCAIIITSLLALFKTYVDVKNGHKNEKHDLICSSLGIIFGGIIAIALML